jgi:predicted nuclease of predicted toxin-antitoxin system
VKFFLDENFPKSSEKILSEEGHEIFDVRGSSKEGLSDIEIFKLAQDKEAIFLTTDKDFFHTIPFQFEEHFGVVIIALRQPSGDVINSKLKWFIKNFDFQYIKSKVILLKDQTYLVKKL